MTTLATRVSIADALTAVTPDGLPFRFTAYDGSATGPEDSPIHMHLASERGLSYVLTAPGDLGMVRAYVMGDLEITGVHPGNPYELMRMMLNQFHFHRPSMTYTCAVYPTADATLEQAQAEKYDLVARKLDLRPGQRLLDIGCGWGGMVRHAAREYGVKALGVTLSSAQAEWASEAIKREGLEDRAEVRFLDYRDVAERDFDAISSIGLTEHIGVRN